jgi:multidrug efflux pump subunit AcrA (membrane-fusion protein)
MSETPEQNIQADEAQAQAGGTDAQADLLNRIQLLEANNAKLLDEKKKTADLNSDLQRQISEKKQADLIQKEDYKTLHSDLKNNFDSVSAERDALQQQLEQERAHRQQDQIKAAAVGAISQSGAVNPGQMYALLKDDLRLKDGNLIILAGGVETDLNSHLNSLKQPGSNWEHNFASSGARGMSATGSSTSTAGGKTWTGMTLSEQIAMKVADRENGTNQAAMLQAQG